MPQTRRFGAVRGRSPSAPTPSWPWLAYLGAPSLQPRLSVPTQLHCSCSPLQPHLRGRPWTYAGAPFPFQFLEPSPAGLAGRTLHPSRHLARHGRAGWLPLSAPAWHRCHGTVTVMLGPLCTSLAFPFPGSSPAIAAPPGCAWVSRKGRWEDHGEGESHQVKASHLERRRMVHVYVCSPASWHRGPQPPALAYAAFLPPLVGTVLRRGQWGKKQPPGGWRAEKKLERSTWA